MKLFECAQRCPERVLAVTDAGETVYYRELLETAERSFGGLGRSLVFLLCCNAPGSLLAYLGALHSDAVPLLLDAKMPPALLRGLLERYRPPCCVVPQAALPALTALLPEGARIRRRIRESVLVETGWEGPALFGELKLLLTTSGSTGSPKLVRISQRNLDANTESIVQYLEIDRRERPITTLPMFYSYGMSVINSHVHAGAAILLTEHTILERRFWERTERERATSVAGVPYTYETLDRLRLTEMELPHLKTLTQAGGKLSERLQRKFSRWSLETGRRFFVMYGQTEASPRMGYLPPELGLEKCGSMGIAIPGGALHLEDETGERIRADRETGELIYTGENVSLGYAETREDLLKGDENGGVLRTGDMAYRDEDGFFYIVGRKKRFIKILGTRYNLDELERGLKQTLSRDDVACVGADDCLQVFSGPIPPEDGRALEALLTGSFGIPPQCIRRHALDGIPVTTSGKTDYPLLNRLCAQGDGERPGG